MCNKTIFQSYSLVSHSSQRCLSSITKLSLSKLTHKFQSPFAIVKLLFKLFETFHFQKKKEEREHFAATLDFSSSSPVCIIPLNGRNRIKSAAYGHIPRHYHHVVIVLPVSGRHRYRWHLSRHDEHGVHSAAPGREWESARCKKPFFLNVPFRHSHRYCGSSFVNRLVDSLRNRLVLVIIIAIPRLVGDN